MTHNHNHNYNLGHRKSPKSHYRRTTQPRLYLMVAPAEQLLENLQRLRQKIMTPGGLSDVSTEDLSYRLRKINRKITKVNRYVEKLLNQDLSEISLSPVEKADDQADNRKDIILRTMLPYAIGMDTLLRQTTKSATAEHSISR